MIKACSYTIAIETIANILPEALSRYDGVIELGMRPPLKGATASDLPALAGLAYLAAHEQVSSEGSGCTPLLAQRIAGHLVEMWGLPQLVTIIPDTPDEPARLVKDLGGEAWRLMAMLRPELVKQLAEVA